jgi:hypothetical protein
MDSDYVGSKLVFCSGNRQLVQRLWCPYTAHLFEFSTGGVAEDTGKSEQYNIIAYQKGKKFYTDGLKSSKKCPL